MFDLFIGKLEGWKYLQRLLNSSLGKKLKSPKTNDCPSGHKIAIFPIIGIGAGGLEGSRENFGISMLAGAGQRGSVVNYRPGVITAISPA